MSTCLYCGCHLSDNGKPNCTQCGAPVPQLRERREYRQTSGMSFAERYPNEPLGQSQMAFYLTGANSIAVAIGAFRSLWRRDTSNASPHNRNAP